MLLKKAECGEGGGEQALHCALNPIDQQNARKPLHRCDFVMRITKAIHQNVIFLVLRALE